MAMPTPSRKLVKKPNSPVRLAVVGLALALAAGGVAQTALAGQVLQTTASYHTEVALPPAEICVGETASMLVRAVRDISWPGTANLTHERVNSLWINGTVRDPAVGKLLATRQQVGFDGNTNREVEFDFVAQVAGTTQISFVAEPPKNEDVAPVVVELKVKLCKAQVTTTSIWTVPGEAGLTLVAKIKAAPLVADTTGHLSGQAQVAWYVHVGRVEDCTGEVQAGASTAEMAGDWVGDQLVVTVTYAEAQVALNETCVSNGVAVGDPKVPVTPDKVQVTLPGTGGYDVLDQILDGPTNEQGKIVILVLPVQP
jgi:hypothetical protein